MTAKDYEKYIKDNGHVVDIRILSENKNLMKELLVDKTRTHTKEKHNILWATDNYEDNGYHATEEIMVDNVYGDNENLIIPRALKDKDIQKARTKDKAEVFTPLWVVKKQIDGVEEYSDIVGIEDYVDRTWIEITCGEGPYISSRYDVETGEIVPISERVGFLDRKLQRINKEITDKDFWADLVYRAYKASYGYEWSGDSLLLARENVVLAYMDYYVDKWGELPSYKELQEIIKIVQWNIFQMDGLKGIVPMSDTPVIEKVEIKDLFGVTTKEVEKVYPVHVTIKNWKTGKTELFPIEEKDVKKKKK